MLGDDKGFTEEGQRVLAASPRLPTCSRYRGHRLWDKGGMVSSILLEQGKGREL